MGRPTHGGRTAAADFGASTGRENEGIELSGSTSRIRRRPRLLEGRSREPARGDRQLVDLERERTEDFLAERVEPIVRCRCDPTITERAERRLSLASTTVLDRRSSVATARPIGTGTSLSAFWWQLPRSSTTLTRICMSNCGPIHTIPISDLVSRRVILYQSVVPYSAAMAEYRLR